MYVLNRKRFRQAVREIRNTVLVVVAVIWFCVFIYEHSGLNLKMSDEEAVREFIAYEYVTGSSAEDRRLKETVPVKVVYRYVESR